MLGLFSYKPQDYALDGVVAMATPINKASRMDVWVTILFLSEKQVVNNACEALMRLPGVRRRALLSEI